MLFDTDEVQTTWPIHSFCSSPHFQHMDSSSESSTPCTSTGQTAYQRFHFVDCTPKSGASQKWKGNGDNIRVQAARASAQARIDTMRKRAEGRRWKSGEGVFSVHDQTEPEVREPKSKSRSRRQAAQFQVRETSMTLHSHTILGGTIPESQANVAILAQFLNRFKSPPSASERPWVELVLAESTSSATPSLISTSLQANATALCANDLQEPAVRERAIKLHLSAITQLQSLLKSPRWRDSTAMWTCMIISLFECIQSKDPTAARPHVSGVAYLIQQKGPHSFIHGLEHKTFRYYRINLLLMSLGDRKPCFLAEPDWKTIPFSSTDCPPKTVLDQLIDILVEVPGVLAAAEALQNKDLSRYVLVQKAFELAYWVRCLIYELEKWKVECIWTYPTLFMTPNLKHLDLLALFDLATGLVPYDAILGEALNCYAAAHLILARIARPLVERSIILRAAVRPPYSLRDLVVAISLVSERHIGSGAAGMVSMMVTAFPLKVAEGTTELHDEEPKLLETTRDLLGQINEYMAKKYNINYSVDSRRNSL